MTYLVSAQSCARKLPEAPHAQLEQGGATKTRRLKYSKQSVDENPRLHVLVLTGDASHLAVESWAAILRLDGADACCREGQCGVPQGAARGRSREGALHPVLVFPEVSCHEPGSFGFESCGIC